jgi:hypothetical protein
MRDDGVCSSSALEEMQRRIALLEGRELSRVAERNERARRRRRLFRLMSPTLLAVGLVAVVASADPAISLSCPGGDLFCFDPRTPARASEVNHNFAQTKSWLEQKVGTVGTEDVTVSGVMTMNGPDTNVLLVNNQHTFLARNTSGSHEPFLWPRWSDNYLYMNYGSGGMRLRNNASEVALEFDGSRNAIFSSDVSVQGNLYASNLQYSPEFAVTAIGESGYGTRNDLWSTSNSFCFLTRVRVPDDNDEDDGTDCVVWPDGATWRIQLWTSADEFAEARCHARCFRFAP